MEKAERFFLTSTVTAILLVSPFGLGENSNKKTLNHQDFYKLRILDLVDDSDGLVEKIKKKKDGTFVSSKNFDLEYK